MPLENFGPSAAWNIFKDDWFATRRAAGLFFVSTLFVFALIPVFQGRLDLAKMTLGMRATWTLFGIAGTLALFFLWIGMWKYWARVDASRPYAKKLWFLILLLGFWYGACLYCYFVYLPQVLSPRSNSG